LPPEPGVDEPPTLDRAVLLLALRVRAEGVELARRRFADPARCTEAMELVE